MLATRLMKFPKIATNSLLFFAWKSFHVKSLSLFSEKINFLVAIRCGELHPPMLARTIASLDHMLKGRLTINIISSNLPGMDLSSRERYARSREVIQILKQSWSQDQIKFKGN